MKQRRAFKYELMPNGEQQRKMHNFAGACRFVFNEALALQKENHEAGNKFIGYVAMCKSLTGWRNGTDTPWLSESPVHPLQHALKDLDRAYTNFFAKRAGFPTFKKKGRHDSFHYPDGCKLDEGNDRIWLPKLGWIRYHNSRRISGTLRNVTVSYTGDKWFASVQTEEEVEVISHSSSSAVGIDMGIARFVTLSDGAYYAPLNSFKWHQAALRKAQRIMSHKRRFSSNWRKAKAGVRKVYAHIKNTRQDYLHKITAAISKSHAMVYIEDLRVSNMSKSAKGTVETPGKRVKAKSGLNRSILDQGWGEFRRQLDYKLAWRGGWLVAVPPQNTSRACPACSHVSAHNRQTQARFLCVECGYAENADLVAAINIRRAGRARLACQVSDAPRPPAAGTRRSDLRMGLTHA